MSDNSAKQPTTSKSLNKNEFRRIMENLKYRKKAEQSDEEAPYIPHEMGLFLTARCNLRCKHCFEWNEDGFLTNGSAECSGAELPLEMIQNCLEYTRPAGSRLYLWGGEPLMYSHFHELACMLKEDKRWTTICTNGLLIERHLDDIIDMSENLVLLISLDGFEDVNDKIRGKGEFSKVIEEIRRLRKLQDEGRYRGEISVCCVISDDMIGRLYEFAEFMEGLEINSLYLSFPWYIAPETAVAMDEEVERRFGDIIDVSDYSEASWHDFTFHISPDKVSELKEDIRRINGRSWKIRVRFQPAVQMDEVEDFVDGGVRTVQGRSRCLVPYNRVDILQGGEVSVCKLFREFTVGSLKNESLKDIWEGENMREIRSRLKCGLMPACSKCVLLYQNGV